MALTPDRAAAGRAPRGALHGSRPQGPLQRLPAYQLQAGSRGGVRRPVQRGHPGRLRAGAGVPGAELRALVRSVARFECLGLLPGTDSGGAQHRRPPRGTRREADVQPAVGLLRRRDQRDDRDRHVERRHPLHHGRYRAHGAERNDLHRSTPSGRQRGDKGPRLPGRLRALRDSDPYVPRQRARCPENTAGRLPGSRL